MNDLPLAIDAHVRFHPEIPFVAFFRLVHLRVAFLFAVLCRTGRVNDRRIDNGASGDLDATTFQMKVHCLQYRATEVVLFQKMTKLADRRLVRHRLVAKIDLRELAHQRRVVQCLFDRRVREVEPLLQKVDTQHAIDAHRPSPIASFGVVAVPPTKTTRSMELPAPSLPEMLHDGSSCCTAQIQLSSLGSAVSLSSESLDSIYTMTLWKAENLIRVSLGSINKLPP